MGLSLIFFVPAYYLIACVNRIMLKRLNNSVCLKYGFFPFVKEISFLHNELKACLYKCDFEQANKVKKPGQIIFSLIQRNQDDSELLLSVSDTESQVISAFEKLVLFIGQSSQHELSDILELASGERLNVSKSSLSGNNIEGKKKKYFIISNSRVAFKSNWFLTAVFGVLIIMGLFIAFGFMNDELPEKMSRRIFNIVLVSVVVALMVLGGISGVLYFSFRRCIIADKKLDSLYYSPFTGSNIKGKSIVRLSEIKAIQICSVYTLVQSGKSQRGTTIYEINAITSQIDKERIGITCGEKLDQISIDSNAFADFLEVPLLDHTTS
jgi:hypothetical protein